MDEYGRLEFTQTRGELLALAEKFCAEQEASSHARALIDDETGFDRGVWDEMAKLGWPALAIDENHGGAGLGFGDFAPLFEQMGRQFLAAPLAGSAVATRSLLRAPDHPACAERLGALASGAVIAIALDDSFCDGAARAVAQGDGYRISGRRSGVLDLAVADYVLLSATIEDAPALFFLSAEEFRGGAVRRETVVDETRRSYEATFEPIEAPASSLILANASEALRDLEITALFLAACELVGGAQAVIDLTLGYLRERTQFGRPIGAYQALKHPMVDAYLDYERALSHLYAAAHEFENEARREIAVRMAYVEALSVYEFAADRSIQFHGAYGFTYDCDAQLHRRRAMYASARFGDAVWHRRLLGELLFSKREGAGVL